MNVRYILWDVRILKMMFAYKRCDFFSSHTEKIFVFAVESKLNEWKIPRVFCAFSRRKSATGDFWIFFLLTRLGYALFFHSSPTWFFPRCYVIFFCKSAEREKNPEREWRTCVNNFIKINKNRMVEWCQGLGYKISKVLRIVIICLFEVNY